MYTKLTVKEFPRTMKEGMAMSDADTPRAATTGDIPESWGFHLLQELRRLEDKIDKVERKPRNISCRPRQLQRQKMIRLCSPNFIVPRSPRPNEKSALSATFVAIASVFPVPISDRIAENSIVPRLGTTRLNSEARYSSPESARCWASPAKWSRRTHERTIGVSEE